MTTKRTAVELLLEKWQKILDEHQPKIPGGFPTCALADVIRGLSNAIAADQRATNKSTKKAGR